MAVISTSAECFHFYYAPALKSWFYRGKRPRRTDLFVAAGSNDADRRIVNRGRPAFTSQLRLVSRIRTLRRPYQLELI
jgi:hypothetical protein